MLVKVRSGKTLEQCQEATWWSSDHSSHPERRLTSPLEIARSVFPLGYLGKTRSKKISEAFARWRKNLLVCFVENPHGIRWQCNFQSVLQGFNLFFKSLFGFSPRVVSLKPSPPKTEFMINVSIQNFIPILILNPVTIHTCCQQTGFAACQPNRPKSSLVISPSCHWTQNFQDTGQLSFHFSDCKFEIILVAKGLRNEAILT